MPSLPRQTLTSIRPMGEEILPETLLERFRASQDRQSRAMVLYRPPTNLVEKMLGGGRGEPDGEEAEAEAGGSQPGAERADLAAADGSSDENSSSGSGSSAVSRRGSTKDSAEDVDMS